MIGKLIGVGVGPGDPELLTLRAVRLIQSAPVLAYVVDGKGQSFARKTASGFIRPGQEELPLNFTMSQDRSLRIADRKVATSNVLSRLNAGMDVVFITEGDPLLYSSFQHLLNELPAGVPKEICPGVSAMNSAAAAAAFSLALENEILHVSPANTGMKHLHTWLSKGNIVVLFKAGRYIQKVRDFLSSVDIPCESIMVERVSTPGEAIFHKLEDWPDESAPYFSIILIRPDISYKGKSACISLD